MGQVSRNDIVYLFLNKKFNDIPVVGVLDFDAVAVLEADDATEFAIAEPEEVEEDDVLERVTVELDEVEGLLEDSVLGGWVLLAEVGLSDSGHDAACGNTTLAL